MTANELYNKLTAEPCDWEVDSFHATHTKTGIKFWVANGLLFMNQEGGMPTHLGFINRIRLYYWLKKAARQKLVKYFK